MPTFFSVILIVVNIAIIFVSGENAIGNAFALSIDGTLGTLESELPSVSISASGLCLDEHNAARQSNGKSSLQYDTKLENAAKNHNQAMTSKNCFNHQCSGEPKMPDRVTKVGYRWGGVAENIAAGQTDCKAAMGSWMNSSGHKANILGDYKHVGCAVSDCSNCQYNKYWTCVFARPM